MTITERIKHGVEKVLMVEIETRKGFKGSLETVDAKKIYALLCKELTFLTLREIGETINRDHATIIHLVKVGRQHLEHEIEFNKRYDTCLKYVTKECDLLKDIRTLDQFRTERKQLLTDFRNTVLKAKCQ